MDYQEIVDQFISNENELTTETEIPMTKNQTKINRENSPSSNEIKVKSGFNTNSSPIIDITNENYTKAESVEIISTSTSTNTDTNTKSSINEELVKIQIHMKSLIKARQQTRQTVLLQNIKQRNRHYTEFKAAKEQESEESREKAGRDEGLIRIKNRNNERRRAILKENKEKNEGDDCKNLSVSVSVNNNKNTASSTEMEIDVNNDNDNDEENKNILNKRTVDELIPCRLELDYDGYRLSDVLLLPSTRTNSTSQKELEAISTQMCQDYELPVEPFQGVIVRCLKDQLEEWDVYQGAMEGMKIPFEEIGAVPLRLDVIVGLHRFEDQLEVSLDPLQSTGEVMHKFVKALQSPDPRVLSETDFIPFKPLILHNLLEQLMLWRRAIVFGGFHRDGRSNNLKFHDGDVAVLLNDVNSGSGSVTPSVRRHFAHTNTFTPILSTLTIEELDKIEAGRERESRRRRRTTGVINTGPVSGKRSITNANTTNTTITTGLIVNNLSGTVRSPPRTLPTPTSYRGTLHRIRPPNTQQSSSSSTNQKESDGEESFIPVGASSTRKRQQRGRKGKPRQRMN